MVRSAKSLLGYRVSAAGNDAGKVTDIDFDGLDWVVRYLVAAGGDPLGGRNLLISPVALQAISAEEHVLPVSVTVDQLRNSPDVGDAMTVSRELEAQYHNYFGWPPYWTGGSLWGAYPTPAAMMAAYVPPSQLPGGDATIPDPAQVERENHLRSAREVFGYAVQARDGGVGNLVDFLIEDETWAIHHLVVDTTSWLPGGEVIVAPSFVTQIEWTTREISVNLTQETIRKSPAPGPETP